MKCLEDFEKTTGVYKSFCPFFSKSLHISILHKMFHLFCCLMCGDDYKWRVAYLQIFQKKKCKEIFTLMSVAYFVHIWNISNIICHKISLKFNLSTLIEHTRKCITILIQRSYKLTTLRTQNSNRNAVL